MLRQILSVLLSHVGAAVVLGVGLILTFRKP